MEEMICRRANIFSSEWKTERVREDASGDREDGEEDDDELPCVIGEETSYFGESERRLSFYMLWSDDGHHSSLEIEKLQTLRTDVINNCMQKCTLKI